MSDQLSNVDLSDLFVQIKNNCEAIAYRPMILRLKAYAEAVGAMDGGKYQSWKQLPEKALRSLDAKLKKELAAMPPEKAKAMSPQVEQVIAEDQFF